TVGAGAPARAPAWSADAAELDAGSSRRLDGARNVLAWLESANRQHVLPVGGGTLGPEEVVDCVGHDVYAIDVHACELRRLATAELGDGYHPTCLSQRRPDQRAAVEPRPHGKRLRVAQNGEVVHGDDGADARSEQRAPEDRAVQQIRASARGLPGGEKRVPRDVAGHCDEAPRAAPADRYRLDVVALLQCAEQAADPACCARLGLLERSDVDGDLHAAASSYARRTTS